MSIIRLLSYCLRGLTMAVSAVESDNSESELVSPIFLAYVVVCFHEIGMRRGGGVVGDATACC